MRDILPSNNRASRAYPFPGGIAGKLGDRFEAKWAIKKLFEVILGHADALKFEFVDPVNHGVEFWVAKNGSKEWYQAKKQNVQGNWTIRRLAKEGVLDTALSKLSASPEDRFFFLSAAPATQLEHLAQRAVLTETGTAAFLESLDKDGRLDHLPSLNRAWGTTVEQAWEYLRRLQVLCESETNLDIDLRMVGGLVFSDSSEHFFPTLREYLENNFNRELTTEIVRGELIESGLLTPRAPLDPSIRERISDANRNYLDSYVPFDAGGTVIVRKETQEVLALLEANDGPSIILLTGNAGTGKSGVVRQILAELEKCSATFLAFRIDKRLGIDSPAALGQALYERRENPIFTLQSLASISQPTLFIDQIDAISEISGRIGAIREVVFELLRFAKASGKIKIIAACRSYDLANDSSLRELEKEARVSRVEIKHLDWASEIEPLLGKRGFPVERITTKQRELLTLPLNLALFLETTGNDEPALSFQSTTDLFDRLIQKKDRSIRDRGYPDFPLMTALSELAAVMSRNQILDAPAVALDRIPHALDLLAAEHLIFRLQGRVSFFHESFFDYAFARSFVADGKNLLALLTEDEQHLFRRTQIRQILAMYRQIGPRQIYLKLLRELLTSPDIRYHIKDAVARWLGGGDAPQEDEFDVILTLDIADQEMPQLVRLAIYPQHDWLPILLRRGLIAKWLNSENENRRNDALNILRTALKTYPEKVTETVRGWWAGDSKRGSLVLGWLSWLPDFKPSSALLDLNCDLIRSKPEGLFDRTGLYDRHSLSTWIKHDPAAAGEILRVWFETWYEVFPEGQPFERDGHNDLDYYWIEELQKKSSAAFLKAAIPAFVEAIRRINLTFDGQYLRDYTWQARYDRDGYGAGRFLSMLRKALAEFAKSAPDQTVAYLREVDPFSHPAALFLWLETIGSAGSPFGYLLPTLLSADQLFKAGPTGARWMSFARAANASLPHQSQQNKTLVETRILNHWPELNYAKRLIHQLSNGPPEEETRKQVLNDLRWNGYQQWCCLQAIDQDVLSPATKIRLAALNRKFVGKNPEKPSNPEARVVPPPIRSDRAKFMSDSAWVSAISAFHESREEQRRRGDWAGHTGSRGLAGLLRGRTKEEPERFARLLSQLPLDTAPVYFNEILSGLSEGQSSEETLKAAIRFTHGLANRPCCEGICHILQKHPTLARENDIFAALLWYVENGPAIADAEIDLRRTQELLLSAANLTQRGGFSQGHSVYYDRGFAAEALAAVLWDCGDRLGECIRILQNRIEQESLESVRCFLTEPIYSVLRHDSQIAAKLFKGLILRPQNTDLQPLSTYTGTRLLFYLLQNDLDIGRELLDLMLTSKKEEQRLLGAFHLFREAFYDDTYATQADVLVGQGEQYRKLAAHVAANHLPEAAYLERAIQQLIAFFDDPIKEVRTEAAECFREIWNADIEPYRHLMLEFIRSKAFGGDNFSFFHLLNETHRPVTEEVLLAAERFLKLAEHPDDFPSPPGHRQEIHSLDDLLLREYRATDDRPTLRKRILDILDKMLLLGISGTDKIIQEHERI